MKYIGDRLISARKKTGLTQEQSAKLVGISLRALQGHEKDEHRPGDTTIGAYAAIYKCDQIWLLTGDSNLPLKMGTGEVPQTADGEGPWGKTHHHEMEGVPFDVITYDPKGSRPADATFKVSGALTMAARVLESKTSYATALYLNIQHFDRAIQAELRLTSLEKENKQQGMELEAQRKEIEELKERLAALEGKSSEIIGTSPEELKESAAT